MPPGAKERALDAARSKAYEEGYRDGKADAAGHVEKVLRELGERDSYYWKRLPPRFHEATARFDSWVASDPFHGEDPTA